MSHWNTRGIIVFTGLCLMQGCGGPPQISRANRRIVESLATAISARNTDWLSQNVAIIAKARADGKLSDAENDAFQEIVDKAEAKDWVGAEQLAFALRDAQRASSEDMASAGRPRLRKPKPSHEKKSRGGGTGR